MVLITLECQLKNLDNGLVQCTAVTNSLNEDNNSGEKIIKKIPQNPEISVTPLRDHISIETIRILEVSHCQLHSFPKELLYKNLIELDISYNKFQHVPRFIIAYNSNLKKLNISHNNIINFNLKPKCFLSLQTLKMNNNFIREIPEWIFESYNLKEIDLNENPIKYVDFHMLGKNLVKLETLKLNNTNFTNNLKFVQEIPNLKKLYIGNNNDGLPNYNTIEKLPFKLFACAKTLLELDISRVGYSFLYDDICELQSLEILDISFNNISWLPTKFTDLKSLRILNVSHNELICLPSDIGKLINLTILDISFNLIDSLPESLMNLTNLKNLDCYCNDLTDSALKIVKNLSLTCFDIEQNLFTLDLNENNIELRKNMRIIKNNRLNGPRVVEEISNEEDWSESSSVNSKDVQYDYVEKIEENWDYENIFDDSYLVLPPYSFKINNKPISYSPSDYIHPMYFEDALEDQT